MLPTAGNVEEILPTTPLLIRFGRIGDMVLQTPLLHILHRRFGRPCRLLTSGSWSQALFAGNQDVGEIWQLRARHLPFLLSPARWRLVGRLRRHAGPIYVSEDSGRQLSKIRRLIRLSAIRPERCVFLPESNGTETHWVDRLLCLGKMTPSALRADDYPWRPEDVWSAPRLDIRAEDRADREAWLRRRGLSGRPLVLLQPGNKRAIKWGRARLEHSKVWPIASWAALLRAMHSVIPGARLMLCGAAREEGFLHDIRREANVDCIEIAAADLPLRRALAVMEIAHSMVAVDTGPAHIAAAVGCPLVVLYGAESPQVWGRRSVMNRPVIEIGGPPELQAVGQISLDRVLTAWLSIAHRTHDGSRRSSSCVSTASNFA